jgi:hypothetical protein
MPQGVFEEIICAEVGMLVEPKKTGAKEKKVE